MPLQGSLDNRYEVKTSLGRGGMAEVYLARDRVLDRDVALKILSRCYAEDEDFVRRFRREAQSAASLAHPNVVSIHDLGEVEGEAGEPPTYYIAMEYVKGISLRELLEREVRLPYETAVSIARQVAEGLSAAHERGIVHRDIKPHNILLSGNAGAEYPGEGRGGVKVADFGIARAASSTTTNTEGILGTAYYLSPEQAMGGEATYQSDLYSLGVVLYEMLTGRRPYDAESPFGVAMRHVTGDLRPPKQILPDLPAELNSIVVRLLGKDPEERPGDAEELLADLEDLPQSFGAREANTPEPEEREASSGGKSRQRGAGLLVPICALIMLTVSLWGVQQGYVGSSLTGFNPSEFRDDVGRILGGGDGDEAPQSGGAQPDPAARPTGGATNGEDSNRERARDKTQEEAEATGESREDSSGADSADGEEPAQDTTSGEGSPYSPDNGSSDNDSSDNGSAGGGAEGDASGGGSTGSTSEDTIGGASDGSSGGQSGGEASGGGASGGGASGGGADAGEEQRVYVPDLTGQTVETARAALNSTGFEVAGVIEQPGRGAEGTVLYTDPAAGSARESGTGVTLIVSSGPGVETPEPGGDGGGGSDNGAPGDGNGGSPGGGSGGSGGSTGGSDEEDVVSVPDVTGRQSEQAVMILQSAGLTAEVRGAFGGEDSGTVVATDPAAGSTVEEGTTVTLTVTDEPQAAMAPGEEDPSSDQYQYED